MARDVAPQNDALDVEKIPSSLFRPIRTRKTFEEALGQIVEAIRAGTLRIGDRLPAERILANRMEISRPTVREAIRVLVDTGVLEVRSGPGGGTHVVSDVIRPDLLEQPALLLSDFAGVLVARRMFEPRAAQLAGLQGTESDFLEMERTIDAQRLCIGDHRRFNQLDYRYHLLLAKATHNATVIAMARVLLDHLQVARDMTREASDTERALELHVETLEAVRSGDMERIEIAMDHHLSYLERFWEEETGRRRVREVPPFLLSRTGD